MLVLNKQTILDCITYEEIIASIEKAYEVYYKKEFFMPHRPTVTYHNKTLLYMPCITPELFGTKVITVFPDNLKLKKPVIDGIMLLNDYETGTLLAMLDAKILTSLRTGAVGGVGMKYFTDPSACSVGLVGAGVQGFYQLIYACHVRSIQNIYLFDSHITDYRDFISNLQKELDNPNIIITVCDSTEQLLAHSQIIITATTSTQPVLPNDPAKLKGKNIIAIGSYQPNARELPDALFSLLKNVVVDFQFAVEESGDLHIPLQTGLLKKEDIYECSTLLYDKDFKNKVPIQGETTLYKSVGMGLFDLVVGQYILEKAILSNLGQEIMI